MKKVIGYESYGEVIQRLKECIYRYETLIENNKFGLVLANGDYLNVRIPRNQIAHLLGVQTDKLRTSGVIKKDVPSYNILKQLINYDITYYDMNFV